jgi:hypothetical protein
MSVTGPFINNIGITGCDNELYILASVAGSGPTSEICHITSGYNQPVSYNFNPGAVLKPGTYDLFIIGINGGSQAQFDVTLTGPDTSIPLTYGPTTGTGVWTASPIPQVTVGTP